MGSIFAYYRPRGIKGNYTVVCFLDLLPTENARVSYDRGATWHIQFPIITNPKKYRVEIQVAYSRNEVLEHSEPIQLFYKIKKFAVEDRIEVHITDTDVDPWQGNLYKAGLEEISCELLRCGAAGIIELNKIQ